MRSFPPNRLPRFARGVQSIFEFVGPGPRSRSCTTEILALDQIQELRREAP